MLSTLPSAFWYWARISSTLILLRWKKPRFFSVPGALFFSSTTRLDSTSPTSPKSLVRTLFKAFSEKEAMFFWAAVPYCKI